MGLDTRVSFPPQTRLEDVAKVAALLLGHKGALVEHRSSRHTYEVCEVEGIKYSVGFTQNGVTDIAPDYVTILLDASGRQLSYSFEGYSLHYDEAAPWGEDGRRYLSMGHGVVSIALAKALVDFFGGQVDYNDCDDIEVDYEKKRAPWRKAPNDGEAWRKWQVKLASVKPLTEEQLWYGRAHAAEGRKDNMWGAAHVVPREDGIVEFVTEKEEVA